MSESFKDSSTLSISERFLPRMEEQQPIIKKSVGLIEAFCFTFGMIIGSGIFITVNPTFKVFTSDSIGMVTFFWTFGGIVALLGGLCYAELGTKIPESGGDRAYYQFVLNEKFARTFVIVYIFLVKSISLSALALTAGTYFSSIIVSLEYSAMAERLFAALTLIICFVLNSISKTLANKAGIVLTLLKMLALLIIIGFGINALSQGEGEEWNQPFNVGGFDIFRFAVCIINIFWSYEGWNSLGLIAGDMRNPSRDFPIAIITGIIMVMIFYVMTTISYSAVLGFDHVRISKAVASDLAIKTMKQAYPIIPLLVCCSAAGAANGNFFAVGTVCVSAGYRGELPKIFSLIHRTRKTPIFSLIIELIISLCFLFFDFQSLLTYSSFISWFFYFISLCCLIKIKLDNSGQKVTRVVNVPYVFIIFVQLMCLFVVFFSFYLYPIGCGIIASIILLTYLVQYIPQNVLTGALYQRFEQMSIVFFGHYFGLVPAQAADILPTNR